MSDIVPFALKTKLNCPCEVDDCTVFGIPLSRHNGHVKGCKCRSCSNGATRKRGLREQSAMINELGGKASSIRPGNEEWLRLAYRVEFKSELPVGPRKVKGSIQKLYEWFGLVAGQSETSKALGDVRPFIAGASLVGEPYRLFVVRADQWDAIIDAAIEQRQREGH